MTCTELSIAMSIVDMAMEEAEKRGADCVSAVHLKLGLLSGVVSRALLASYELACENTPLEGSRPGHRRRSHRDLLPELSERARGAFSAVAFVYGVRCTRHGRRARTRD